MLTAGVAMRRVEDLSPAFFLGQYAPSLTPGKWLGATDFTFILLLFYFPKTVSLFGANSYFQKGLILMES